jgi:hypothetical protein
LGTLKSKKEKKRKEKKRKEKKRKDFPRRFRVTRVPDEKKEIVSLTPLSSILLCQLFTFNF